MAAASGSGRSKSKGAASGGSNPSTPRERDGNRAKRGSDRDEKQRVGPNFVFPSPRGVHYKTANSSHFLGQGTFSQIFGAFDTTTQESVAIKMEKMSASAHILLHESKVLQTVANTSRCAVPRWIDFFSVKLPDGSSAQCIVMEKLGENLSNFRKRQPNDQLSCLMSCQAALSMFDAIVELHRAGYVHRDLKPGNFLLQPDPPRGGNLGQLYLIDFGLAIKKDEKSERERLKEGFRGSSLYASVTQHDEKDAGPADDLWCFWFVLIDLIYGILPWKALDKELRQKEKKDNSRGEMKKNMLAMKQRLMEYAEHYLNGFVPELGAFAAVLRTYNSVSEPDYGLLRQYLVAMEARFRANPPTQLPKPIDLGLPGSSTSMSVPASYSPPASPLPSPSPTAASPAGLPPPPPIPYANGSAFAAAAAAGAGLNANDLSAQLASIQQHIFTSAAGGNTAGAGAAAAFPFPPPQLPFTAYPPPQSQSSQSQQSTYSFQSQQQQQPWQAAAVAAAAAAGGSAGNQQYQQMVRAAVSAAGGQLPSSSPPPPPATPPPSQYRAPAPVGVTNLPPSIALSSIPSLQHSRSMIATSAGSTTPSSASSSSSSARVGSSAAHKSGGVSSTSQKSRHSPVRRGVASRSRSPPSPRSPSRSPQRPSSTRRQSSGGGVSSRSRSRPASPNGQRDASHSRSDRSDRPDARNAPANNRRSDDYPPDRRSGNDYDRERERDRQPPARDEARGRADARDTRDSRDVRAMDDRRRRSPDSYDALRAATDRVDHLSRELQAEQTERTRLRDALDQKEREIVNLTKLLRDRRYDIENLERKLGDSEAYIRELAASAATQSSRDAKQELDDALKREFNIWVSGERRYFVSSKDAETAWERALEKANRDEPAAILRAYESMQYAEAHRTWREPEHSTQPEPVELLGERTPDRPRRPPVRPPASAAKSSSASASASVPAALAAPVTRKPCNCGHSQHHTLFCPHYVLGDTKLIFFSGSCRECVAPNKSGHQPDTCPLASCDLCNMRGHVRSDCKLGLCVKYLKGVPCQASKCTYFHPKQPLIDENPIVDCTWLCSEYTNRNGKVHRKCASNCQRYHWSPIEEAEFKASGVLPELPRTVQRGGSSLADIHTLTMKQIFAQPTNRVAPAVRAALTDLFALNRITADHFDATCVSLFATLNVSQIISALRGELIQQLTSGDAKSIDQKFSRYSAQDYRLMIIDALKKAKSNAFPSDETRAVLAQHARYRRFFNMLQPALSFLDGASNSSSASASATSTAGAPGDHVRWSTVHYLLCPSDRGTIRRDLLACDDAKLSAISDDLKAEFKRYTSAQLRSYPQLLAAIFQRHISDVQSPPLPDPRNPAAIESFVAFKPTPYIPPAASATASASSGLGTAAAPMLIEDDIKPAARAATPATAAVSVSAKPAANAASQSMMDTDVVAVDASNPNAAPDSSKPAKTAAPKGKGKRGKKSKAAAADNDGADSNGSSTPAVTAPPTPTPTPAPTPVAPATPTAKSIASPAPKSVAAAATVTAASETAAGDGKSKKPKENKKARFAHTDVNISSVIFSEGRTRRKPKDDESATSADGDAEADTTNASESEASEKKKGRPPKKAASTDESETASSAGAMPLTPPQAPAHAPAHDVSAPGAAAVPVLPLTPAASVAVTIAAASTASALLSPLRTSAQPVSTSPVSVARSVSRPLKPSIRAAVVTRPLYPARSGSGGRKNKRKSGGDTESAESSEAASAASAADDDSADAGPTKRQKKVSKAGKGTDDATGATSAVAAAVAADAAAPKKRGRPPKSAKADAGATVDTASAAAANGATDSDDDARPLAKTVAAKSGSASKSASKSNKKSSKSNGGDDDDDEDAKPLASLTAATAKSKKKSSAAATTAATAPSAPTASPAPPAAPARKLKITSVTAIAPPPPPPASGSESPSGSEASASLQSPPASSAASSAARRIPRKEKPAPTNVDDSGDAAIGKFSDENY